MGTWTTKFRKPALIAGLLAISIAANTAFAKPPGESGSKRGGAGFTSGAIIGGAAAGPIGVVVGASLGAVMGERSHKKSQALAARKAEAALLASEARDAEQLAELHRNQGGRGRFHRAVPHRPDRRFATTIARASPSSARWLRISRTCACASRASRIRAAMTRST